MPMNLVELIIWVFSLFIGMSVAVLGYSWYGIFGAVGGLITGIFAGLCVGLGIAKRCYRPPQRRAKMRKESQ
jgi:hypothetical protein